MYEHIYRFGERYTLTPFDDLDDRHRERFRLYVEDKRYCALLRPVIGVKLTIKAVNRDLADFLTLMKTPRLVGEALSQFPEKSGQDRKQFILQLVLDGVLEVQHEGTFISGLEAVNKVLLKSDRLSEILPPSGEETRIQYLSKRALYFAIQCTSLQPRDISFLLYNYNRIPVNRRWHTHLPDEPSLRRFLGLREDNSWPGMPDSVLPHAVRIDDDGQVNPYDQVWQSWRLGNRKKSEDDPSYKIYFSPTIDSLPEVFDIVRTAAAGSEAYAMKIGRTLPSVLRPDKLIVYFPQYPPAREFAEEIARRLGSFPVHGTPFSCQVSEETALVTMGVDPPECFGERYSWRLYVVQKLGLAILGARDYTADPLAHIYSYIRLMGIDADHWRPTEKNWKIDFKLEEQGDAEA